MCLECLLKGLNIYLKIHRTKICFEHVVCFPHVDFDLVMLFWLFVVEDNNLSVHTPTDVAWGKRMDVPENVIYYQYKMSYPHHGTGKWVNF